MSLPYHILDVFTPTPFLGNPLAVVTIPPKVALSTPQKQAIAKEFNLSETVFVHDIEDPIQSPERHFDIFEPNSVLRDTRRSAQPCTSTSKASRL